MVLAENTVKESLVSVKPNTWSYFEKLHPCTETVLTYLLQKTSKSSSVFPCVFSLLVLLSWLWWVLGESIAHLQIFVLILF